MRLSNIDTNRQLIIQISRGAELFVIVVILFCKAEPNLIVCISFYLPFSRNRIVVSFQIQICRCHQIGQILCSRMNRRSCFSLIRCHHCIDREPFRLELRIFGIFGHDICHAAVQVHDRRVCNLFSFGYVPRNAAIEFHGDMDRLFGLNFFAVFVEGDVIENADHIVRILAKGLADFRHDLGHAGRLDGRNSDDRSFRDLRVFFGRDSDREISAGSGQLLRVIFILLIDIGDLRVFLQKLAVHIVGVLAGFEDFLVDGGNFVCADFGVLVFVTLDVGCRLREGIGSDRERESIVSLDGSAGGVNGFAGHFNGSDFRSDFFLPGIGKRDRRGIACGNLMLCSIHGICIGSFCANFFLCFCGAGVSGKSSVLREFFLAQGDRLQLIAVEALCFVGDGEGITGQADGAAENGSVLSDVNSLQRCGICNFLLLVSLYRLVLGVGFGFCFGFVFCFVFGFALGFVFCFVFGGAVLLRGFL